jgi:hypothetical protein
MVPGNCGDCGGGGATVCLFVWTGGDEGGGGATPPPPAPHSPPPHPPNAGGHCGREDVGPVRTYINQIVVSWYSKCKERNECFSAPMQCRS